ncbi:FHA domain-containing protein [Haliovirga abyssi]|uniref:FHA domain-containing protein n=1 Tax=Haliovirga abyssi TaxID=2996794 RepID=A0AAU9DEK2_9FUSO|nr:FHA domain-containing protein [Haliovirga abyssi]BDU50618.1 hypothetical protein HLVA_11870 [Haliovirga abyssi]
MKMKKCDNGHLFNSEKFEECPYCSETAPVAKKSKEKSRPERAVRQKENNDMRTQAIWSDEGTEDYVVGWLTCIEGPDKGNDYQIKSEKNFIGRSEEMHIQIQGDSAISRRNHAIISYNPKERNFILIPGEGRGIIYKSTEAIYTPTELNGYDVIEMGKSKFIFVPLCGDYFEWENVGENI